MKRGPFLDLVITLLLLAALTVLFIRVDGWVLHLPLR